MEVARLLLLLPSSGDVCYFPHLHYCFHSILAVVLTTREAQQLLQKASVTQNTVQSTPHRHRLHW